VIDWGAPYRESRTISMDCQEAFVGALDSIVRSPRVELRVKSPSEELFQWFIDWMKTEQAISYILKRSGVMFDIPAGTHIAISGKLGSAKTTCADLLVQHHGYKRMSLTTPLKKLLQQIRDGDWLGMAYDLRTYPWEENGEHGQRAYINTNEAIANIIGYIATNRDDMELWDGKGRHFLQMIGTNWFRNKYPGIWCRLFEREWNAIIDWNKQSIHHESPVDRTITPVVVDDIRFPDELHMFKRLGFLCLRCNAPESVRLARIKPEDAPHITHASETALDGYIDEFDALIDTSCSMEQQHKNLLEAIERGIKEMMG
jgi:hypothetical protein